jgi:hypothetical protein
MVRLSGIFLAFLVSYILFSNIGCMLNTSGLAPIPSLDADFHGCFERAIAPGGQIIIIQESSNLLRGTGFGLFDGWDRGWTFTGRITTGRVATLHITMDGETFDVDATRPTPDPPDDLTLQRSGSPVITLSRCP